MRNDFDFLFFPADTDGKTLGTDARRFQISERLFHRPVLQRMKCEDRDSSSLFQSAGKCEHQLVQSVKLPVDFYSEGLKTFSFARRSETEFCGNTVLNDFRKFTAGRQGLVRPVLYDVARNRLCETLLSVRFQNKRELFFGIGIEHRFRRQFRR